LVPDDGSSSTKATSYNYGTNSDRALGNIPTTASGDRAIQVAITNDSGELIPGIELTYTGEQWRDYQGTSENGPEQLRMYFSTEPGSGFIAYPVLDFTAPSDSGLNAAIDGNDAANRATVSGVIVPPSPIGLGDTFYLTWHDWNDLNTNDHGLAIDDVRISVNSNFGDFNKDGAVDLADYGLLLANFNMAGGFAEGDFDFNGQIDLKDFVGFRRSFNAPTAAAASVPEPSSMLLFGLAFGGLSIARRRRR
jgi:hypothetical protein